MAKNHRDARPAPGGSKLEFAHFFAQKLTKQKDEGIERGALGVHTGILLHCQVCQERLYVRLIHDVWMLLAVEMDECNRPVNIGFFCFVGQISGTDKGAKPVDETSGIGGNR